MACKQCNGDWLTATGKDCKTCPHCSKLQRCRSRKTGRWVEPTQQKTCRECNCAFTAVGLKAIGLQWTCNSTACNAARRKRKKREAARRRTAGIYALPRTPKPKRHCAFSECGKELLRRDQKRYCSKRCFFAAVRSGVQPFKGRRHDAWSALVDWAHGWYASRPIWTQCLVCNRCIEQCRQKERRFCDDRCRYRHEHPLPTNCCECGCEISNKYKNHLRCVSCTKKRLKQFKREARRLLGKYRTRCRYYGVPYDPAVTRKKVFERDRYVCQLCRARCLRRFTLIDGLAHPLSPTVDHVVALSLRRSGHTWDNVQCACWQCNVSKGARARGQLRLVLS